MPFAATVQDVCWRHEMETFSALLALCARNSPVTGGIPSQRPVTRSFEVFFDLRLNERLSKQCVCVCGGGGGLHPGFNPLTPPKFSLPTPAPFFPPFFCFEGVPLPKIPIFCPRPPPIFRQKPPYPDPLTPGPPTPPVLPHNNREAGDLRRPRAHYDVTAMDYQWATGGNFHGSCEPTRHLDTRQSQPIFKPTNHKGVMHNPTPNNNTANFSYAYVSKSGFKEILT